MHVWISQTSSKVNSVFASCNESAKKGSAKFELGWQAGNASSFLSIIESNESSDTYVWPIVTATAHWVQARSCMFGSYVFETKHILSSHVITQVAWPQKSTANDALVCLSALLILSLSLSNHRHEPAGKALKEKQWQTRYVPYFLNSKIPTILHFKVLDVLLSILMHAYTFQHLHDCCKCK